MDPNTTHQPSDPGTTPAGDPATGDPAAQGSLLAGGAGDPPAGDDPFAWLPQKFRVTNDAGEVDEAASARKLAESYVALEKHKGPMLRPPEKPEDYKIEPPVGEDGKPVDGVDLDAFVQDPMFKGLAARAHAAGIPNEHMQFFVHEYLRMAPEIMGEGKALTLEEASQELSQVWTDKATFDRNLGAAIKAVREFTKDVPDDKPGSNARVLEKFANDPDFVAFAARLGNELKFGEDVPPGGASTASDVEIESKMKSEPYWNPNHPDHAKVKAEVAAYFAKRFPPTR